MTIYNVQLNVIIIEEQEAFDKVACDETLVIYGEDSLIGALYEMKLRITETINKLQELL